jgi:hypothetical protein
MNNCVSCVVVGRKHWLGEDAGLGNYVLGAKWLLPGIYSRVLEQRIYRIHSNTKIMVIFKNIWRFKWPLVNFDV